MALMDYLKKATPTDEDVMAEMENQQKNAATNEDAGLAVSKPETSAVAPAVPDTSSRPEWMNEDDWNAATQYYSPERISQLYKRFDPNSVEPFYQTLYKTTRRNPAIPDEKRIRAANNIASAADGLKLIIQGIAGAKGAYIPEDNRSATNENDAYVQRLRDIYRIDRDRYDTGLYQSTIADIEAARQGHNRDRGGLLGFIQNAARMKNQREIVNAKNALDLQKWQSDQDWRKAQADSTEEYRNKRLEIDRMNAASNARRAIGTSKTLKNGDLEFFDANTATTYTVNEKKFKANALQMFLMLRDEILADDENLRKRYNSRKGKLSSQEQEDAVKKYMYNNPKAMQFLSRISKSVYQDKSLKASDSEEPDGETNKSKLDISQFERKSAIGDNLTDNSMPNRLPFVDYDNLQQKLDNAESQKKAKTIQYFNERMKDVRASLDRPMYFPTESTAIR